PATFPLIVQGGLGTILGRERRATRREQSNAPTSTTIPGLATPYLVGVVHHTFVDHTRGTPARGGSPASSSRAIATTIYYPASAVPTEQNPKPSPAPGPFPLLVFAHGYAIDAAAYRPLLHDLAVGGFVVAAPDFPGTSTAHPGSALRSDSLE